MLNTIRSATVVGTMGSAHSPIPGTCSSNCILCNYTLVCLYHFYMMIRASLNSPRFDFKGHSNADSCRNNWNSYRGNCWTTNPAHHERGLQTWRAVAFGI